MSPTIIFIPGAWHTPDAFAQVSQILSTKGYECTGVNLRSVGAEVPCQGHDEDAGIIRSAVEELLDAGKDVLLVVHSYGSIPACDAIVGLSKTEREAHGRAGGVVALVYIAAFILPEGASLIDGLGGNDLPWWDVDRSKGLVLVKDPVTIFYLDLSDSDARYWADQLQAFSYKCFFSKVKYAAWQHIPCTYIFAEDDQAIPLSAQKAMVEAADGRFKTASLKTSHSPFLSMPSACAGLIVEAMISINA